MDKMTSYRGSIIDGSLGRLLVLKCVTSGSILTKVGGFFRARVKLQARLPPDGRSSRGRFDNCGCMAINLHHLEVLWLPSELVGAGSRL